MSILCYVTFNDGGSVLKTALVNGGQCSPSRERRPEPQAELHNRTSTLVMRTAPKLTPSCSPNLFKQIKSTPLFHLTFIWRARPPLSLCFLLFLSVYPSHLSLSARGAHSFIR